MNQLARIRKQVGFTQKYAAMKLGITQASLSRYEAGLNSPSYEMWGKLGRLYGTTVRTLQETDEQANCKFCHWFINNGVGEDTLLEDDACWAYLEKDEGIIVESKDLNLEYSIPIKYCPKCGRYLGDEFGDE